MNPLDNEVEDPNIVNVYDYCRSLGLSDLVATQLVFHMLLTRTFGFESDVRECALELDIILPYVFPDSGITH